MITNGYSLLRFLPDLIHSEYMRFCVDAIESESGVTLENLHQRRLDLERRIWELRQREKSERVERQGGWA